MADQPPPPPGTPQPEDEPVPPLAPPTPPTAPAPPPQPQPPMAQAPLPPASLPEAPLSPASAPDAAPPPGTPGGYYPQQPYYAPGWTQAATEPRSRRGQRIALFSVLAIVVLAVAGTVAAAGLYWWGTKPVGDVTSPTSATSRQVRVGHCIRDLPADGGVGSVTIVPCGDPHEAEVLGSLNLGEGPWPGDAAAEQAAAWCEMDTEQAAAGYRPVVWTPSEQSWSQGDRIALCLAWLDD